MSIDTSGCSYNQQHRRRRTVRSLCRLATIEYQPSSDEDHVDFFAVVDVAIPIDDLEHLGSRITLKSTKVLVHVLSVGKRTLQGESNRLYGYEARCSVGNDNVEIRVVSTVYTLSMGLF